MNTFASYKKALRVIDSCTNILHLAGARTYVNLFFSSNSEKSYPNKYTFTTYVTDDFIAKMYNRLLVKLLEKERDLND
jgi:hypothetical protein